MITSTQKAFLAASLLCILTFMPSNPSLAFAYIFAGSANGLDVITHPSGYTGSGGVINVTVGINPASTFADDMVIPVQNVITVFNELVPTTGNLQFGAATNVPNGSVDFESTLLHEMGHSLGLAHVNAATESGVAPADRNYTKATFGPDFLFNLNAGPDGVKGSLDDVRGDDVNLNYFRTIDNNPFGMAATVDQTTYSRHVADLPTGHMFSANADREVASLLGFSGTEAVMQQGTYFNEAQRTLNHDDVAGIRYAASGLDEIAGTADDYTLLLTYAGQTTAADIVIAFDNTQTGFAVSSSSGSYISGTDHIEITANNIYFNDGYSWFFNNQALPVAWAQFTVQKQNQDAVLHWATYSEINHDRFEIERSTDRQSWEQIAEVNPTMSSTHGQSYQYRDPLVANLASSLYYRIRQIDIDGRSSYSEVRELVFEREKSELITMGPIPIRPSTFVEIFLSSMDQVHLIVMDQQGREVSRIIRDGAPGINKWVIGPELLQLPGGTYLLRVDGLSFQSQLLFSR